MPMRYLTLSLITLAILLGALLLTFVTMEIVAFETVNGTVIQPHVGTPCYSVHYGWDQTTNHVQSYEQCNFAP